jgi:hypothetical protein
MNNMESSLNSELALFNFWFYIFYSFKQTSN